MLSNIVKTFYSFVFPTTNRRVSVKRSRDDGDDSEPGELAKRLCTMTESNMSAKHHTASSQLNRPSTSKATEYDDVEVLVQRAAPSASGGSERRICSPRRPGRRLTDPPAAPPPGDRQVPVLVERSNVGTSILKERGASAAGKGSERVVPILVEGRQDDPKPGTRPTRATATASKGAKAATSGGDDDVVVIEQKKGNGAVNGKGPSRSDFAGVRSFRQMLETGRVAGRASPLKRQQLQQQRTPKQQTLYDKLMGIAPAAKIRRGISATLNCFRLDEKKRYQQLLAEVTAGAHSASLLADTSFRTRSLLASTPLAPAALRRDRLGPAATSELVRRVSLVDLVSTGSESSAADWRRPTSAATAAAAIAGPPQTVLLSGSEGDSQPTSVVVSDDDSVVVERVVPAPPRKRTQLDEDISRHLKHFAEVRESYAASERERRRRVAEEEQRGAISRVNHAEWERHLAQRLRRQMRLTQRLALPAEEEEEEDEEEEESALPELTAEMEGVISAALRPTPPSELMADAFNLRVTRHDLQTLKNLNWLNDEVINFYMSMLMERSKSNEKLPKVYCFNTFFYGKIVSQGHSSVKRWTRKIDIFAHDLLMIPVHLGMHWCLACVDLRNKAVRYFDSMLGNNNRGLDAILRYLREEHADKKKQPLNTDDWQAVNEKEIPQQMNGSDCGMFACKFAEYLSRDARLTFTQEHMPYFRRRMVYEIVTKKLL